MHLYDQLLVVLECQVELDEAQVKLRLVAGYLHLCAAKEAPGVEGTANAKGEALDGHNVANVRVDPLSRLVIENLVIYVGDNVVAMMGYVVAGNIVDRIRVHKVINQVRQ